MLTLYVKTGCPFCAKVLATAHELNVPLQEKNVADPGIAAELVARGGKKQEPYLVDDAHGVAMYEAPLIEAYLRESYGAPAHG